MKALTIVLASIATVCLVLWLGIFCEENFCLLPKPCTVLSFGQRLSFADHDDMSTTVDGVDSFVFRRSPKDPAEILVTAQSTLDLEINKVTYAEQKYEFNLYRGGPLRRISEQLWASGWQLTRSTLEHCRLNCEIGIGGRLWLALHSRGGVTQVRRPFFPPTGSRSRCRAIRDSI